MNAVQSLFRVTPTIREQQVYTTMSTTSISGTVIYRIYPEPIPNLNSGVFVPELDMIEAPNIIMSRQKQFGLCPDCGGNTQKVDKHTSFCLDCDWDNLKIIA